MEKDIGICDEYGSKYLLPASKMKGLCSECSHILYGYENCSHVFKDGRCEKCLWDGSESAFIKNIKENER